MIDNNLIQEGDILTFRSGYKSTATNIYRFNDNIHAFACKCHFENGSMMANEFFMAQGRRMRSVISQNDIIKVERNGITICEA